MRVCVWIISAPIPRWQLLSSWKWTIVFWECLWVWRIKKQTPSWKSIKNKIKWSVSRNLFMNRMQGEMQVTGLFGDGWGLFVFLAPDERVKRPERESEREMKSCNWCDVLDNIVMLMQCCNEEMKGLRREIVNDRSWGFPLQIILERNDHFLEHLSWGSLEKRKEAIGQSQHTDLLGRLSWTSSRQMRRHEGWQASRCQCD